MVVPSELVQCLEPVPLGDFNELIARVAKLEELALEKGTGPFERKKTSSTCSSREGSDCAADLAEARWEVLQDMIEQEQEARNKDIRMLKEAVTELPKFAAQALGTECQSSASSCATDPAEFDYLQENAGAATEAFKMIAEQIRSEVRQQLEESEQKMRKFITETLAASMRQMTSVMADVIPKVEAAPRLRSPEMQARTSLREADGTGVFMSNIRVSVPPVSLRSSLSPERSLNSNWTPACPPPNRLPTPSSPPSNRLATPKKADGSVNPDRRTAAALTPGLARPRTSPWMATSPCSAMLSPRRSIGCTPQRSSAEQSSVQRASLSTFTSGSKSATALRSQTPHQVVTSPTHSASVAYVTSPTLVYRG
mmetsp:Transcript_23116/g.41784  ORF Transcript_23116/g.41784 Transcript_23116/m.41784 type:complete len:368 (-) Transcript_23116:305-1408(-)